MTTRGLGPEEFEHVADMIDRVVQDPEDEATQEAVRSEVERLCENFPLYHADEEFLAESGEIPLEESTNV
jgi:glycine hydroxymethyltransferase